MSTNVSEICSNHSLVQMASKFFHVNILGNTRNPIYIRNKYNSPALFLFSPCRLLCKVALQFTAERKMTSRQERFMHKDYSSDQKHPSI